MAPRKRELPLLESIDDILNRAREINQTGEPYKTAVAAAHDEAVIEAVVGAHKEGITSSLLFGNGDLIREKIESLGGDPGEFEVVDTASDEESADKAAEAASSGRANAILKGNLSTSVLLKNALKQKYGLRRKGLLSHTAILAPKLYTKLLAVSDGGMVIHPTFEQKVEIIRNACLVGWALGIKQPRVAVLTAIDYIVEAFPETFQAAALSKMSQRNQLKNCIVDGPMSFDTAILPKAVNYQALSSPVAGRADIVLVGSIEEGNILAKSLIQFGGASFAGVIVGANVPIALVSRADPGYFKMASIALAVVVAHYLKQL